MGARKIKQFQISVSYLVPMKPLVDGSEAFAMPSILCMDSTVFPDWPVVGPNTVEWVLKFIRDRSGSPTAWHALWKSSGRLEEGSHLVMFHDRVCQMLETAVCYDQFDVTSIALMELLVR